MKKIICLGILFALLLSGCGNTNQSIPVTNEEISTTTPIAENTNQEENNTIIEEKTVSESKKEIIKDETYTFSNGDSISITASLVDEKPSLLFYISTQSAYKAKVLYAFTYSFVSSQPDYSDYSITIGSACNVGVCLYTDGYLSGTNLDGSASMGELPDWIKDDTLVEEEPTSDSELVIIYNEFQSFMNDYFNISDTSNEEVYENNNTCEKDGITAEFVSVEPGSSYVDLTFKLSNNTDKTISIDSCRRNFFNSLSIEQFGIIEYEENVESGKSTLYELTVESSCLSIVGSTINDIELYVMINDNLTVFDFHNLNIATKLNKIEGVKAEPFNNIEVTLIGIDDNTSYPTLYFRLDNNSLDTINIKPNRRHYVNDLSIEQFGTIDLEENLIPEHSTIIELTVEKKDLQAAGNTLTKIEFCTSIDGVEHSFVFDGISINN